MALAVYKKNVRGLELTEYRMVRFRALRLYHEDVEELFRVFARNSSSFRFFVDGGTIHSESDIGAASRDEAASLDIYAADHKIRLRLDEESAEFLFPAKQDLRIVEIRETVHSILIGRAIPFDFITTWGFPLALIVFFVTLFQVNAVLGFMGLIGQYFLLLLGLIVFGVGYFLNFRRYCVIHLVRYAERLNQVRRRRLAIVVTVIMVVLSVLGAFFLEIYFGRYHLHMLLNQR